MTNQTLNLTPALYDYMLKIGIREAPLLKELRHITASMVGAQMQISPEQGQFMSLLVHLCKPKKALELGVFTGYSSLVVAMALPPTGKLVACDINEESTAIAKTFWEKAGVSDKVELRIAAAIETLDALLGNGEAGSFDFAFIDADKRNYEIYYEKILQLLRPGGLLLLDNTLQRGQVVDLQVNDPAVVAIRQLNEKIVKDPRVEVSMLPVSDGLTLVLKR